MLSYTREKLTAMVIQKSHLAKIRSFTGKDIIKVCTGVPGQRRRDNDSKTVLYPEGSFRGNCEGIPAMRVEDRLMKEVSKCGQ